MARLWFQQKLSAGNRIIGQVFFEKSQVSSTQKKIYTSDMS